MSRSRAQKRWLWASFGGAASVLLIAFAMQFACAPETGADSVQRAHAQDAADLEWVRELRQGAKVPMSAEEKERLFALLRGDRSLVRRQAILTATACAVDVDVTTLEWIAHESTEVFDTADAIAQSGGRPRAAILAENRKRTRRALSRLVWVQATRTRDKSLAGLARDLAGDADAATRAHGVLALALFRSR